MAKYSRKVIMAVADQINNMWYNNIERECGNESFEGWCEDGDVFYNTINAENYTDEEIEQMTALMKDVAPLVDEITYKHFNYEDIH